MVSSLLSITTLCLMDFQVDWIGLNFFLPMWPDKAQDADGNGAQLQFRGDFPVNRTNGRNGQNSRVSRIIKETWQVCSRNNQFLSVINLLLLASDAHFPKLCPRLLVSVIQLYLSCCVYQLARNVMKHTAIF